ncbi:MAG: hypothetical protein V3T23_05950 [Nitrososphaerales archaeon]
MSKRIAYVAVYLEVPYEGYSSKAKNNKADAEIRRWVRETAQNELSFIPLYVEKEPDGSYIEDVTDKSKIKVKRARLG